MQRIILSLMLAFFCGSVAAEWTLLAPDTARAESVAGRGTKVFINKDSITREGTRATMYTLKDYESPLMVGGKRQMSTKQLDEYDCENKKYRTLAYYWYSRHQAKGDLVYDDTAPGRMLPIIDDSTIEERWKIACGK